MSTYFRIKEPYCYECILITGREVFASSKYFPEENYIHDFETAESQGISDVRERCKMSDIKKYTLIPVDKEIQIEYKKGKETGDVDLEFNTEEDFQKASELLAKATLLVGKKQKYGVKKTIYSFLFGIIVALLTYTFGDVADQIKNGTFEVTGRRKGLQKMMAWVIDLIGKTGVYIIGGIFIVVTIFAIIYHFKSRNKEVEVFKR